MTRNLDYAGPSDHRPSRVLGLFANLVLLYPPLLLGLLYGQWLLSWLVLGHRPRPSVDDPKSIAGASWMHGFTFAVVLGFFPALFAALIVNTLHAVDGRARWWLLALRLVAVMAAWGAAFALIQFDPGRVMYWWLD